MEAVEPSSSGARSAHSQQSPLRWAGSKRKLLPVLRQYWRETDRKYIEAFAGSACLFFDLQPKIAVLNDSNAELISSYEMLAKDPARIHAAISSVAANSENYYLTSATRRRSEFQKAVRFFYLNRFCFNGIYRTNKMGDFNVPFGSYKTGGVPSLERWLQAASALKSAKLYSSDFEGVVRANVGKGDFVYLDPPYAVSNRRVFKQYSATEFGESDLLRLRSLMRHIHDVGATFVVSYALSKETAVLAKDWYALRQLAQRNIAGFSHQRRKAVEVLITNDPSRIPGRK